MMRRTIIIAAVALAGLVPLGAAAGEGAYATINLGAAFTQDATNAGSASAISIESEFDTGVFVSGAAGYRWAQGVAVEGEILYSKADIDKLRLNNAGGTGASLASIRFDGDVSTVGFMVNGAYNHDTGTQWTPFIKGGVGVAKISVNDITANGTLIADDDDTVFAYQIGAGVDFAVNDQFGIGLAYRYFGTADPTFKDSTGTNFDSELSQHIISVRGTVNF